MRLLLILVMLGLASARVAPPGSYEDEHGREKRFVDYPQAWKHIFSIFPETLKDVQENAEIRLAAETARLNGIEHKQIPAVAPMDPYQTNFNPGEDEVLYVSMSRVPMDKDDMPPVVNKASAVRSVHKRQAEVQNYNPGQRASILGKYGSTQTHYARINGAVPVKTSKVEQGPVNAKVTKRSTKDMTLDDFDLADAIIEESKTPEEAFAKMVNAERILDTALHKVMGDLHESDSKDVDKLESILNSANLPSLQHHIKKRSIEANAENTIKEATKSMAAAHNMLQTKGKEDKVLEEVIKADRDLTALLEMVLTPKQIKASTHERTKRDHNSEYYDPNLNWLINDLELSDQDGERLKSIVYGESSVESPQFYAQITNPGEDYDFNQQSYSPEPSYSLFEPDLANQYVKYGQRAVVNHAAVEPHQIYYDNFGREHRMEEERSTFQKLLDSIGPIQNVVPAELDAAYKGALEVGKHVTKRVRPYAHRGYDLVTKEYIPKASSFVRESIGDDLKEFARQGKKIVESRAKSASKAASPHLENLKHDLLLLQQQIKQVATEANEFAQKEVAPNLGQKLNGLLFDVQETLELANQIVVTDVKPLVEKVSDHVIKPSYYTVTNDMVYPTASTVNDYVFRPVSDSVSSYVVNPVSDHVVQPVYRTATPLYQTASSLAATGADTAKITYHRLQPSFHKLSTNTQKVLTENVVPTAKVAASQVADGAYKFGGLIQSDVMPKVQYGVSTTLDGLFTGIPSLVKQVSHGANDAAKIFSNRYEQALQEIKHQEAIKRKEEEAKLNLIHKELAMIKEAENEKNVKKAAHVAANLDEMKAGNAKDMKKFDAVLKSIVSGAKALKKQEETESYAPAYNEDQDNIDSTEATVEDDLSEETTKPEPLQTTTPKEL